MEYKIIYTKNKHWYVSLKDWILVLRIPSKLKNNKEFENTLLQKWKELLSDKTKIQRIDWKYTFLFWEKTPISDIIWTKRKTTLEKELKTVLYEYSQELLDIYSQELWFEYTKLSIKKLKSKRWSCSHDQKIVLNLDLVYLPSKFAQYVIIHEACHLKHKNHSKDFRHEVSNFCENYKEIRKELRNINIH